MQSLHAFSNRWGQDIDYEFERDTIIRLYKGKGVLEKMSFLENRVLQSFGIHV